MAHLPHRHAAADTGFKEGGPKPQTSLRFGRGSYRPPPPPPPPIPERDRLRPISTSASLFFFRVRPIQLRPISTSANFDLWMLNFGTTKGGALKGGSPKGGPEGWGPKGGAQTLKRWGPEAWGSEGAPKISRFFFFPLPPLFSFFFSLFLGFLSLSFGGVFEAPGRWDSKRAHFRVRRFKHTTKIQRKETKRGRKNENSGGRGKKKSENLG